MVAGGGASVIYALVYPILISTFYLPFYTFFYLFYLYLISNYISLSTFTNLYLHLYTLIYPLYTFFYIVSTCIQTPFFSPKNLPLKTPPPHSYRDTICDLGGVKELANYGEYSGAPSEQQTYEYAKTILSLMTKEYHPEGKVFFYTFNYVDDDIFIILHICTYYFTYIF